MFTARRFLVGWAAFVGLVIPGSGLIGAEAGQRWAVLVGVNQYAELADLNYCVADARRLRDQLVAAGFGADNVFLLVDGAASAADLPNRQNIQRRIESVLKVARDDDLVLVAFSGHGVHLDGKSYFCPTDASLDSPQTTMVPLDFIYRQLDGSKARQKLLLVDACRNDPRPPGSRDATSHKRSLEGLDEQLRAVPAGITALSSSAAGQISWEDDKLGHGVFLYHVLDGLAGKADEAGNRDGVVSLLELYNYAYLQTTRWVLRNRPGYVQTPELYGKITGDMVLAHRGVVVEPPRMKPPAGTTPPLAVAPFDATAAKAHQQAWSRQLAQPVEVTNSIGMKLALIPPGEFMMGSPRQEIEGLIQQFSFLKDLLEAEQPQHRVRITKPYYLGMYEVTQSEYERVMGTNPSAFSRGGSSSGKVSGQDTSRFPVENVSWEDAMEFCRKLSSLPEERATGRVYRLPTEAEWEYACRAGTITPFHFGAQLNGRDANCDGNYPYGTTTKGTYLECPTTVGSYGANGFGLCNMHGNVWEWCSDWYDSACYANSPIDDPTGPTAGSDRVARDGGWSIYAGLCRSASRGGYTPDDRGNDLGFRVTFSSVDASGR